MTLGKTRVDGCAHMCIFAVLYISNSTAFLGASHFTSRECLMVLATRRHLYWTDYEMGRAPEHTALLTASISVAAMQALLHVRHDEN